MKNLLMKSMGITETKIAILDMLIKLADKQNGYVSRNDLRYIKKELIRSARDSELDEAFERTFGKKNPEGIDVDEALKGEDDL